MNRTALVLALLLPGSATAQTTVTYFHVDGLGSPVASTDEAGNVLWREAYTPFGRRLLDEPAAAENSTWYTGHVEDEETGLVYAQARYYDPDAGRFLRIDPASVRVGDVHSFNRYTYANNNPYGYTDPDGQVPVWAAWTAGAAVGGLVNAAIGAGLTKLLGQEYTLGTFLFDFSTGAVGMAALSRTVQLVKQLPRFRNSKLFMRGENGFWASSNMDVPVARVGGTTRINILTPQEGYVRKLKRLVDKKPMGEVRPLPAEEAAEFELALSPNLMGLYKSLPIGGSQYRRYSSDQARVLFEAKDAFWGTATFSAPYQGYCTVQRWCPFSN